MKYKLTISYETDPIEKEYPEQVLEDFFEDMALSNMTPEVWISENAEITEITKEKKEVKCICACGNEHMTDPNGGVEE